MCVCSGIRVNLKINYKNILKHGQAAEKEVSLRNFMKMV
jgi:hypothetical protein